jgi:hypothetical protein
MRHPRDGSRQLLSGLPNKGTDIAERITVVSCRYNAQSDQQATGARRRRPARRGSLLQGSLPRSRPEDACVDATRPGQTGTSSAEVLPIPERRSTSPDCSVRWSSPPDGSSPTSSARSNSIGGDGSSDTTASAVTNVRLADVGVPAGSPGRATAHRTE